MLAHWFLAVLAIPAAFAIEGREARYAAIHDRHEHSARQPLPNSWYHHPDHPAHALFRRGPSGDGVTYAEVGSPEWAAPYPPGIPDSSKIPQEWKDALAAAEAAGKIPNIPQSILNSAGVPVYPQGVNPLDPSVCSGTAKCRNPLDFWDAPPGYMGAGFDDGPFLGSPLLYSFLQANNIHATHFMIGEYILQNPTGFLEAFETMGDDIAVHTWSHRYMTSLSNADVVAELAWPMQIIHNSTQGRLPRFWRPPMGDSDERVRAIANYIFGLETIYWNEDTEDWSLLNVGGTTLQAINTSMTQWLSGPKTPGLIILEHELSTESAQGFISAYPDIIANGWKLESVATLVSQGAGTYQNAINSSSPVTPVNNDILNESLKPPFSSSTPGSSSQSMTASSSMSSSTGKVAAHSAALSLEAPFLSSILSILIFVVLVWT